MATIIKKPNGRYIAQVYKAGTRKAKTFKTKTEAKVWAAKIETDLENNLIGNHADKTFLMAIEKYATEVTPQKKTARNELYRLEKFKVLSFAYYPIQRITSHMIADYRDSLVSTLSAASALRDLAIMSSIFDYARREWKWVTTNPVKDVKKPRQDPHRTRILSDDEIASIVTWLDDQTNNGPIAAKCVQFALETGMRRSEITGLHWCEVMPKYVILPDTKNRDTRHVPLSRKAVGVLDGMRHLEKPFPINNENLTFWFMRAIKALSINNAHFHDLRAVALTKLSKKLNVLELAKMIGHRDTKSLMIYYRETADEIADKLG